MSAQDTYKAWISSRHISEDDRTELLSIAGDPDEIEARFFAPLSFGTAGLRGVMGMGLHRMNVHVVRHTTQALANLIVAEGPEAVKAGAAIAYDCRYHSAEFAREAACVLAAAGIPVRLFDELRPTPELSFAIREYGCTAGINITASHNPKEYNGYKVYWSDGAQLPPQHADVVAREMARLDVFEDVRTCDFEAAVRDGRIVMLGAECDRAFLACVLCQSVAPEAVAAVADSFKLVYTPFHGAGYRLVPEALRKLGFKHILCEPSQMIVDGGFPTVVSPNPENKEGFALAIELARQNDVDLIIGTDPDCDRVGIVLRDQEGDYVTLSGNQVGVLLTDYLIRVRKEKGTLPHNPAIVKTIVTTEMARVVAEAQGAAVFDTFTGFKFLAEAIAGFERDHSHHYIFAYEESYGYLAGDHARDKDAVVASTLIAEMAAWYRQQSMTLYDAMQSLYERYGHFRELTLNLVMPGLSGMAKMAEFMKKLRQDPPLTMAGQGVLASRDYLRGERYDLKNGSIGRMALSGSDVLYFELSDGSSFIVRPSGTEPKIKIYLMVKGETPREADAKLETLRLFVEGLTD